ITDICDATDVLNQAYQCGGAKYGEPVKHPLMEHNVTITNGAPGVNNVRIIVNGAKFEVAGLQDGESRTIDVVSAMKGDANTFSVEALGKPGGTANVAFWGNTAPARKQ